MRPAAKLRKYLEAARASARSRAAYAGDYLGSALTYCLFVFVFSRVWRAVYAAQPEIAGYRYERALWYFVAAELPYFAVGRYFWDLAAEIKSGQIAYVVGRPYSFVLFRFSEAAGSALAAALPLAASGLALGAIVAGPPPIGSAAQAAALLLSLVLAASVQFLFQLAIAMTAFWVEENTAFFWIFQKLGLVAGTLMPLEYLPPWAARAARWTPFPAMSYAPARILAAWSPGEGLGHLATQATWTAAAAALCAWVYGRGRAKLSVQGG